MMRHVEHRSSEENEAIHARQQREVEGDSSEYIVHTRSVDRSLWLQISYALEKYKVLLYLGGSFLVASGYGWKTPKANYEELREEIAVVRQQVQRDSVQKSEIQQMLRVLITFKCIESQASPRDMQIAGVDCAKYINTH
jgi:hypothetical protein